MTSPQHNAANLRSSDAPPRPRFNWADCVARAGFFATLWWLLTAGDSGSWIIGLPVVVVATWLSASLAGTGASRLSAPGLARYLVFFVVESIRGGVDVARRVLLPGGRVEPHLLQYRTGLADGLPRDMLVYTVSLLPGTLAVDIEGDRLTLHALSHDMQPLESVKTCERRVAAVFGESVSMAAAR
jgi:multicomponent Na+:H+ antiporter subunit E